MVGRTVFTSAIKWLIPALLVMAGCEEKNPLNLGAFIPPSVIRTDPANGATGVPTNSPIIVTFDMCVDCSSVNNSTCTMPHNTFTKDWCDMCEYEMVLIPDSLFSPNTSYTIVLSKDIRTIREQKMREDYSFSFVTGPGATPAIHHLSSNLARVEDRLTIYGEHFWPSTSGNTVTIGNDTVPILSASADSIVMKVPRKYVYGKVSVTTIGGTGTSSEIFSPLWAQVELNRSGAMRATAWSGSRFAAVGDKGMVAYSDNGFDWYAGTTPGGPSPWGLPLIDVIWDGSQFVAAAEGGEILTSEDGESYVQVAHLGTLVGGLAWNGDKYVAAGGYPPRICTSGDLTTWDDLVVANHLTNAEWTGARFVAVGDSNTILLSDDGAVWNPLPSNGIRSMCYTSAMEFAGQLVVSGFLSGWGENRIFCTALSLPGTWVNIWNGGNWDKPLRHMLVVDDKLVVAVDGNGIYYTGYPIDWSHSSSVGNIINPSTGHSERIVDLMYADNRFIAVCSQGSVVTSPVGYALQYVQ